MDTFDGKKWENTNLSVPSKVSFFRGKLHSSLLSPKSLTRRRISVMFIIAMNRVHICVLLSFIIFFSFDKFLFTNCEPDESKAEIIAHIVPHSHIPHHISTKVERARAEEVYVILSQIIDQLEQDPKRRFIWSELWYFRTWYESGSSSTSSSSSSSSSMGASIGVPDNLKITAKKREVVKRLIREGQFEIVAGGALIQHDEALASLDAIIANFEEGQRWLTKTFFSTASSQRGFAQESVQQQRQLKIAWQIDSYGHSDTTPTILSYMGFDALFINRIHFRIKQQFKNANHLEFVWKGSPVGGSGYQDVQDFSQSDEDSDISQKSAQQQNELFVHVLSQHYSTLDGYDFENPGVRQVTVPRSRATRLVQLINDLSKEYKTHHILIPFGDDMKFAQAEKQFSNMEKIMQYINEKEEGIHVKFSTLSEYLGAVHQTALVTKMTFPLFQGSDFFPYADDAESYWTGFYSSRPSIKRETRKLESMIRSSSRFYSLARSRVYIFGSSLGKDVTIPYASKIDGGKIILESSSSAIQRPRFSWAYDFLQFAQNQMIMANSHHGITGSQQSGAADILLQRLHDGIRASELVLLQSLEHLLLKRLSSGSLKGTPLIRPELTFVPFEVPDPSNTLSDQIPLDIQHPVLFYNPLATKRVEVARIQLRTAFVQDADSTPSWESVQNVIVTDWKGHAVDAQLYRVIVPRTGAKDDLRKEEVKGNKLFDDDIHVLHEDDAADATDQNGSPIRRTWGSKIYLSFFVQLPPLGFSTYFISFQSQSDKSRKEPATTVTQLDIYDLVDGEVVLHQSSKGMHQGSEGGFGNQNLRDNRGKGDIEGGIKIKEDLPRDEEECLEAFKIENSQILIEFDCLSGLLRSVTKKNTGGKENSGKPSSFKKTRKANQDADFDDSSIRFSMTQTYELYSSSGATSSTGRGSVHDTSAGSSQGGGKCGIHVFRATRASERMKISREGRATIAVLRGPIVQQVQVISEGVTQTIRIYSFPGDAANGKDNNNSNKFQIDLDKLSKLESQIYIDQAVVAPVNSDLVVRFESNFRTDSTFHTDNTLGNVEPRNIHGDSPIASNFYPIQSSAIITSNNFFEVKKQKNDDEFDEDGFQASSAGKRAVMFIVDRPIGVTTSTKGAASIELMLHRNHLQDDGKASVGEGLHDEREGQLEMIIVLEALDIDTSDWDPYDFFERTRSELVDLHKNKIRPIFVNEKPRELAALYTHDNWLNRFEGYASYLASQASLPTDTQILSMYPKDDFGDEVVLRLIRPKNRKILSDNSATSLFRVDRIFSEELSVGNPTLDFVPDLRYSLSNVFFFMDSSQSRGLRFRTGESIFSFIVSSPYQLQQQQQQSRGLPSSGNNLGFRRSNQQKGNEKIDSEQENMIQIPPGKICTIVFNLAFLNDNQIKPLLKLKEEASATSAKSTKTKSKNEEEDHSDIANHRVQPPANNPKDDTAHVKATSDDSKQSARDWAKEVIKELTEEEDEVEEEIKSPQGKTMDELKIDYEAMKKKIAMEETRVARFNIAIETLKEDIKKFAKDGVDDTMINDLADAKQKLKDAETQLNESKNAAGIIKEEMDAIEAKQKNKKSKKGIHLPSIKENYYTAEDEMVAKFHGAIAGAAGMLVAVLAVQWVCGRRAMGQIAQQAFVPVRLGGAPELPTKQL